MVSIHSSKTLRQHLNKDSPLINSDVSHELHKHSMFQKTFDISKVKEGSAFIQGPANPMSVGLPGPPSQMVLHPLFKPPSMDNCVRSQYSPHCSCVHREKGNFHSSPPEEGRMF